MDRELTDSDRNTLLARYTQQAEHLRHLDGWDLKVTSGFLTVQIILAGWLSLHTDHTLSQRFAISVIDLSLLIACLGSLLGSKRRRKEVRTTILNINDALGLYTAGRYLADRAINPEPPTVGIRWYEFAAAVGFAGAVFILWANYLTCK
jgi:hypothetical protein